MQHLKAFLFVIFAILSIEGRDIRTAREAKVSKFLDNFAKFKRALLDCPRPRPGSFWCAPGKRDTVFDTNNEMPPPPPIEVFSQARRDENRRIVTDEGETTNTVELPNETILGKSPWEY